MKAKKITAAFLAFSLVLGTTLAGAGVSAIDSSAAEASSAVDTTEREVWVSYPETDYNCVSNYGSQYRISNQDNANITQCGVDGTYGLELTGKGTAFLGFGKTNFLERSTEYVFELTAKSDGVIPNLRLGYEWSLGEWKRNNYTDGIDNWTTYTREITSDSATSWDTFSIEWKAADGAKLYIDDLKIYKKDDETKTNIFTKGNFDKWHYYQAGVDNTEIPDSVYVPIEKSNLGVSGGFSENITSLDNVTVESGVGVKSSSALKITANTDVRKTMLIGMGGHNDTYFASGKTYRVGLKAKKFGDVETLPLALATTNGSWPTTVICEFELSDEWQYYGVDFTFSGDFDKAGYKNIGFKNLTVPDGSYVLIDDIEFYDTALENKDNYFTKGSFDKAVYTSKLITSVNSDKFTYKSVSIDDYEFEWDNYGMVDISNPGEGFNGSSALKITGDGDTHAFWPKIGVSVLASDTEYLMRFKARTDKADSVSKFDIGLTRRWNQSKPQLAISFESAAGIDEIDENWREYSAIVKTDSSYKGNWQFIYINSNIDEGVALYIDDIELYKVDLSNPYTAQGDNIYAYPKGNFDYETEICNELSETTDALFTAQYITDWTDDKLGFSAEVISIDNAKSGNNVLKLGGLEHSQNGRVYYEIPTIQPQRTYVIEFWAMVTGEGNSRGYVKLNDRDTGENENSGVSESQTVFSYNTNNKAEPKAWRHYTVTYTDKTTTTDKFWWPGLEIGFAGDAGTALLIDSISIRDVEHYGADAPNCFPDAGFEIVTKSVDWSSDKFYSNNDASDFSFMTGLEKRVGLMGPSLKSADIYDDIMRENGDFDYNGLVIIQTGNAEIARYEAETAKALGKDIWYQITNSVTDADKIKIEYIASEIQAAAPDNFQGFYFDEPNYIFESNTDFKTATKYLRETYKKRVFSMLKDISLKTDASSDSVKVTLGENSHEYVTDIGYWNYSLEYADAWAEKFTNAINNAGISADARKWVCTILGANDATDTEEKAITLFTKMVDGAKQIDGFGGILLYSTGDTNGYELHKLTDGKAVYDNYRKLIIAAANEFGEKTADTVVISGIDSISSDGVAIVNDLGRKVSSITAGCVYTSRLSVNINDAQASADDILVTGAKIEIDAITSKTPITVELAVKNDVTGDGHADITDLVRLKKISVGSVSGSAAQLAAVGATAETGIAALHIGAYRTFLLK